MIELESLDTEDRGSSSSSSPAAVADANESRSHSSSPDSSTATSKNVEAGEQAGKVRLPEWTASGSVVIMLFGVFAPSLAMLGLGINCFKPACELLIRHPVETLIQYCLALFVPIGNYLVWYKICTDDTRSAKRLGLWNGLALGGGLASFAVCATAIALHYPCIDSGDGVSHVQDFLNVGLISLGAVAVSIALARKLRSSWETKGAKLHQLIYSCVGVILSIVTLGASESRFAVLRASEQTAVNGGPGKADALSLVRSLGGDKDLTMDIGAPKSVGLSGLFLNVDAGARRVLYFEAMGKPFTERAEAVNLATMPDRYLGTHVVGEPIPGLSLVRSEISGSVNAMNLTSNLDWTFVFKNTTYSDQEARAEVGLPPGAVVSNMTLWENGIPKDATVGAAGQAEEAYRWVAVQHRDPALITGLGKGRVLVQCFPVSAHKELKLRVSMKSPLKLDSGTKSALTLPRLLATNFAIPDHHALRLHSPDALALNLAQLKTLKRPTDEHVLVGTLPKEFVTHSAATLVASRAMTVGALSASDPRSGGYAVEYIREVENAPPKHLVVVVDGSQSLGTYIDGVTKSLAELSKEMPTSVVIANSDDDETLEPQPVDAALLERIKKMPFQGGHDNLHAVIKAAEAAGEQANGAVLWLHGPQPALNEEIYITSKFVSKPKFYELALDDSSTDSSEYFRNHGDVGPFQSVARNGNAVDDLRRFISDWQPGGKHFVVRFTHLDQKPSCPSVTGEDGNDLGTITAAMKCKQLIASGNSSEASNVASLYHIVSPVTSAVVLERSSDYSRFGMKEQPQVEENINGEAQPAPPSFDAFELLKRLNTSEGGIYTRSPKEIFGTVNHEGERRSVVPPVMLPTADNMRPSLNTTQGAARNQVIGEDSFSTANEGNTQNNSPALYSKANPWDGLHVRYSSPVPAAPALQGGTNGTIGPQGSDVTYVTGLNTAGTVRVNNLANLEAALNIIACTIELLGIVGGSYLVLHTFLTTGSSVKQGRVPGKAKRLSIAVALIAIGLATPGFVNALVASARDACLFN